MADLIFRKALPAEAERILEIIRQAQTQMRSLGSRQWQDGYPAPCDINADICSGNGWVLCKPIPVGSRGIIAYGAVIFGIEPAYNALEGKWLTDGEYVVVHRLAVADGEKGRGIASAFITHTETLARNFGIKSFRVDTNFDNGYMLRLLDKQGFAYCGKIIYKSGERLAFEKILE